MFNKHNMELDEHNELHSRCGLQKSESQIQSLGHEESIFNNEVYNASKKSVNKKFSKNPSPN